MTLGAGLTRSGAFILQEERVDVGNPLIVTFVCKYNVGQFHAGLFQQFGLDPPAEVAGAVRKRQAAHLAGRHLARVALSALGCGKTIVPLAAGGSPLWPRGVVGSISHTDQYACCSVANNSSVRAIGIDLETIMSAALASEIVGSVLDETEQYYLCTLDLLPEVAWTIAFSAKESLFKALYPEVRCFFDFNAALIIGLDGEACTFQLKLAKDLSPQWLCGALISGRFRLDRGNVFTTIFIMN